MKTYGKVIFEEILDLLQKIFKNTVNENAQKKRDLTQFHPSERCLIL